MSKTKLRAIILWTAMVASMILSSGIANASAAWQVTEPE